MTVTSNRRTRREVALATLANQRAPKLPLTFLGTAGRPEHEQGWQPHMWSHQVFASGAVYAAGEAIHEAIKHGVLDTPLPVGSAAGFVSVCAAGLGLVGAGAGL